MKGDKSVPDTNCYIPTPEVYEAEKKRIWEEHLARKRAQGDGPPRPSLRDEYRIQTFAGKR